MKALLRKEFYLFGGKKTLLILALSALPAILLNWSAIPFAYALTVCILPFSFHTKDDSARWWTYSKTLPFTRNQIVDAKYLFQLLLLLAVGLMLAAEYTVSILRHPGDRQLHMSPFFALYLFFIPCFVSALSFPLLFWTKRHGRKWLSGVVITVIVTPLLVLTVFILPTFLLNMAEIANPPGEVPLTFIVIGGQRYQITQAVVRQALRIAKWVVPLFSLALYGLSWLISRRIYRRGKKQRIPKEYRPQLPLKQDDDADFAAIQTIFFS